MHLSDYHFQPDYNKAFDNIAEEFYLPCMRTATSYDRISGYFGSTIYIIAWGALREFVNNGGKMRIICSPYLSDEDQEAIKEGYSSKVDKILLRSIEKEIDEMFASNFLSAPSRALACLIALGVIDIKIAIPGDVNNPDIKRLFHDKVGVFSDNAGKAVGFRGPMNETFKGLSSDGNTESIDVFPNWEEAKDALRCQRMIDYFTQLWSKSVPGIAVYDFPEAAYKIIQQKAKGYNWQELIDEVTVRISISDRWKPDKSPAGKKPRAHQIEALTAWETHSRRGIFEHATGSGKTFTAMCAIRDALEKHEPVLVLVPSIDLLNQWIKELRSNIKGISVDYLMCGDGNTIWKQPGVLATWTQGGSKKNRIVISTMDTASGEQFLGNLSQGSHLMVVADEVHRLGSQKRRRFFDVKTGARLGLSATPIRYGDPEGTAAIIDYFGGIVPPVFTLADAIKQKVLTPYFYYPQKMYLTSTEQKQWDEITIEINRLIGRFSGKDKDIKNAMNSTQVQMKMIQRSKIIKEASAKVKLAIDVIDEYYTDGQRWIIYCDNKNQLAQVLNGLLMKEYNAYEYHSEMLGNREQTLSYFSINGGILVSIRCLDEGVDIPETTHALILASSKNPREFIQRRGRILRKSEGKHFAYLFDAIVMPYKSHDEADKSTSIIESELARAIQFGEMAENPACIAELKLIAVDFGIDVESCKGGYEDDGT